MKAQAEKSLHENKPARYGIDPAKELGKYYYRKFAFNLTLKLGKLQVQILDAMDILSSISEKERKMKRSEHINWIIAHGLATATDAEKICNRLEAVGIKFESEKS